MIGHGFVFSPTNEENWVFEAHRMEINAFVRNI